MELWLPLNVANISLSNPHMATIVLHGYAPHSLPISIIPLLPLPLHLLIPLLLLPFTFSSLSSHSPFTSSSLPLLPLPLHLLIAEEGHPTPTLPLPSNHPFTLSTYFPPTLLSGSPTPPSFSVHLDTMICQMNYGVCVWVEMDMVRYTVCVTVVLFAQAGHKEHGQMFVCLLRNFLHSSLGA